MTDRKTLEAVLADQEAIARQTGDGRDPLQVSGLAALPVGCDLGDVAACLERLRPLVNRTDKLGRRVLRNRAVTELKRAKIQDAAGLVDAALGGTGNDTTQPGRDQVMTLNEPEPWSEAVDGAVLLNELSGWFRRYIHLPSKAARAMAVWVVAT